MTDPLNETSGLLAPTDLAGLGIPEGLAEDLFMRRVMTERMMTVGRTADALAISHACGDQIAEQLRQKNLVEYHGLEGRDYRISLTEAGRSLTTERMRSGRHAAPMPVPLADYQRIVRLQRADVQITRTAAKKAFADLVLEDGLLDQIGPAMLSDGAIFIYGPPGTGKTSLAERMSRLYEDPVLVPRYIEVDGQLVAVFDPSVHQPTEDQPFNLDPRYILCKRPLIMVGGELTMSMMDLQYDPISGLSTAPIQLLANNGILVLDDFGRQAASPDEILNRWIVPLSRGVDFLRPNTGNKFTVPFELKLVISTNLDPHALGDDAFLRRLRNKVYVGPCSEAAFNWILVRVADRQRLQVTQEAAAYLSKVTRHHLGELRPYVAIDLCELAVGVCQYDGLARELNQRLIDRVASVYFVRSEASAAGPPPAVPSSAVPDSAVPNTAVPSSAVPSSAVPNAAVPRTAAPTAPSPVANAPDPQSGARAEQLPRRANHGAPVGGAAGKPV